METASYVVMALKHSKTGMKSHFESELATMHGCLFPLLLRLTAEVKHAVHAWCTL
jgi:hypothetical protein